VDRGKALLVLGRLAEAQAELEAVLRQRPALPEAVFALGAVCAARGDARGAAEQYERAVALAPGQGRYRASLAAAYLIAGDFARAAAAYRAALALVPGDPVLREGLALAVRGAGDRPAP
jgi:Flp pilus assembly protein TadD